MTTAAPPDTDDPPMATACPMHLIAAVTIEPIRHADGTVDRRITVVVDCGCEYELSLPLHKQAPRRGDLSHCRGNCKT
jgi:hypothetical protein